MFQGQCFNLRTSTWAAGGLDPVSLGIIPPGKRIRAIHLHGAFAGTLGAADTIAVAQHPLIFSSLRLGKWFNQTGLGVQESNRRVFGRYVSGGTATGAPGGGGGNFAITTDLFLVFNDPRRQGPTDGAVATELLQPLSLEIGYAANNAIGATIVVTSGTVTIEVILCDEQAIPELLEEGFFDQGSQTMKLDGGYVYTDIWAVDGALGGTVTPAEILTADLLADGKFVLNNTPHASLVARYNAGNVTDLAGVQAFATPEHLSLVCLPLRAAQLTKAVAIEGTGSIQTTGTLSPRIFYRRIALKDMSTIKAAAAATGVDISGKVLEPQVASKSPIRAMHEVQRTGELNKKSRVMYSAMTIKARNTATPGTVASVKR